MLRFVTTQRILAAIVLLLIVGCLLPTPAATAIAGRPAEVLRFVLAPFQHKLTAMSNSVRSRRDLPVEALTARDLQKRVWALERLNEQLLHDLDVSRGKLADVSAVRRVLKPLVGTPLPVDVVAAPGGPARGVLTINQGTRAGVEEGAVVVSGEFLVGRIARPVGEFTSMVRLINAPTRKPMSFEVRVIDPTGSILRQINGVASVSPDGREFWIEAGINAVQVGDIVRLADANWPPEARGFIVGKVIRRDKWPTDPLLRERAVVAPIRELSTLNHVQVLLKPEPAAGTGGPARGSEQR
jgi:hypothetical protein